MSSTADADEAPQTKTVERFQMRQNECYDTGDKAISPKDTKSQATKLSRLEKSPIILVAILTFIIVASTALAVAAYVECYIEEPAEFYPKEQDAR